MAARHGAQHVDDNVDAGAAVLCGRAMHHGARHVGKDTGAALKYGIAAYYGARHVGEDTGAVEQFSSVTRSDYMRLSCCAASHARRIP